MAGSVMDSIDHNDPAGERVTISPNASRAGQLDARDRAAAAAGLGAAAAAAAGKAAAKVAAEHVAADSGASTKAAAAELGGTAGKAAATSTGADTASPAKGAPARAMTTVSNALPAARGGQADRLTRIKGIGPVNEKKLNDHGIFHFDQVAAWTQADIAAAETYLAFDGRIAREDWVGQAAELAKGAAAAPTGGKRGGN